jgi:hypothetical protein
MQGFNKLFKIFLVKENLVFFENEGPIGSKSFFTFGDGEVKVFRTGCFQVEEIGSFSCFNPLSEDSTFKKFGPILKDFQLSPTANPIKN